MTTLSNLAQLSHTRPIWLRVGTLFDGIADAPLTHADIVLTSSQILFVGRSPSPDLLPPGQSTPDLTLPAHTALPCLIESHAHMFLDGAPVNFQEREAYLKNSPDFFLQRARSRWPKILQTGLSAIRDAGDKYGVGLTLSDECKSRLPHFPTSPLPHSSPPLPFLDSPGAAIHHKGRYGAFMGEPLEDHASPAACVAARVAQGADRIKLLVSGIINFQEGKVTTPPQMSIDEVKALVTAAQSHNRQTFAHASGAPGVEHSIEGGVTTVEHGFFVTDDQLMKMRDRNIAWVPTFAPVQLQIDRAQDLGWDDAVVSHLKRIIDNHRTSLLKAHQLGVTILAGSDAGSCGVPHALGLLDELAHMQSAGLPPSAVLRAATGAPAATLNFPLPLGCLAPHHLPRLILTEHNPLKTVANLRREKSIFFDGTIHECPADLSPEGL